MRFTKSAMKATQKLMYSKDFKEFSKQSMMTAKDIKDVNWWAGFVSFLIKKGRIK